MQRTHTGSSQIPNAQAIEVAHDLAAIQSAWEQRLSHFRSDSVTRRFPAFLVGHPIVSVKQAADGLEVSIPAANSAIGKLVELGILQSPGEKKWGRVFHAGEILARLATGRSS
jgi:hypothetical protein